MNYSISTMISALCALSASVAVVACAGENDGSTGIRPGLGIGPVGLGARHAELGLGEPDEGITVARQSLLTYESLGLEVVLTSSLDGEVSDDARVLAVAAEPGSGFDGPAAPGKGRAAIEAALGPPAFEAAGIGYWTEGVSVVWEGDVARRVAVFAPFDVAPEVPEMRPAATGGGS